MKKINRVLMSALIILLLIVSIILVIVNNIGKKELSTEEPEEETNNVIKAEEIYNEKYWSKEIIKEEKETAPIPIGCEYITGTEETGVIIQNTESKEYLMWIPYDTKIEKNNADRYYENCKTIEMSSEEEDAIKLYGGFYVYLTEEENSYEKIKQINDEEYEKLYNRAKEKGNSINSSLITDNQINQVQSYLSKIAIGKNIIESSEEIKIDKLLSAKSSEQIEKTSNSAYPKINPSIQVAYPEIYTKLENEGIIKIETYEGEEVIVPQGYSVYISNNTNELQNYDREKVIKIKDENNEELRYVWIPVNSSVGVSSLSKAKEELAQYYEKENKETSYAKDSSETIENGLTESIEAYGGFFMGEAELRYVETNGTKKVANTAIGMKLEEDDQPFIIEGNYYRGTEIKTIEKAKEIAEEVSSNSKSVVSHLTYGAEWDAMIVWLIKSGVITQKEAITDSSGFPGAKYKGAYQTTEEGKIVLETKDLKGANGLYGIAGNLAELTMEEYKSNVVTRGGSYAVTTIAQPAGSRTPIEDSDLKDEDIGFRNCLYINADLIENEIAYEKWSGKIAEGFASGDGNSSKTAYKIETPEQLAYLAKSVNEGNTYEGKYIQIVKSFDMNNINWTPIGGFGTQEEEGKLASVGEEFRGYLDGNNNIIKNLTIKQTEEYRINIGLIGNLGENGQISNINIKNGDISGWCNVGGIVGTMNGTIIENCSYNGSVYCKCSSYYNGYSEEEEYQDDSGISAGGIVGYQTGGEIKECTNTGEITVEKQQAGGIVGQQEEGTIQNCRNEGKVIAKYIQEITNSNEDYKEYAGISAGGIVGWQTGGEIKECTNTGEITAEQQRAGGIVGQQEEGTIQNCRNEGKVIAKYIQEIADSVERYKEIAGGYAGGIVGWQTGGKIKECTNTGEITGEREQAGGIVGWQTGGEIKECTNTGEITGEREQAGGIVGQQEEGTIQNCRNEGKVIAKYIQEIANSNEEYKEYAGISAGGIVGWQIGGEIKECTNTGEITVEKQQAGGIVGRQEEGTIQNCRNEGKVIAKYIQEIANSNEDYKEYAGITTGGIVGWQIGGEIKECTNTGEITAEQQQAGGIVGSQKGGSIENCNNIGSVNAPVYSGDIVGCKE